MIKIQDYKGQIKVLESSLANKYHDNLKKLFSSNHAADLALLIQYISSSLRKVLIDDFSHLISHEIFAELNTSIRDEILDSITPAQLANIFSDLETDDAREIFKKLDVLQQSIVLKSISTKDRQSLQNALSYNEKTAGTLMHSSFLSVRSSWKVENVLNYVKYIDKVDFNSYIFVVDSNHKLLGSVSLFKLLKTDPNEKVNNIIRGIKTFVDVNTDQEEVAMLFQKYSLLYCPIVDEKERLVGLITANEILDVIEAEIEEDYEGIVKSDSVDFYSPVLDTGFARMRWLCVTAISSIFSSFLVSKFEFVISANVCLSALMQVICAMGGAYGLQVNTVIVRAISTREFVLINTIPTIIKEFMVALLNSISFAFLIGMICHWWFQNLQVIGIFCVSLILSMIWAGFVGVFIPVVLTKLGRDPALSSGPIVGVAVDMFGLFVFLGISAITLL